MKQIRIAMWSGPRNISTALMRSFENRSDTTVIDEPFYAYYLKETNFNHPMKNEILKNQESKWNKIISICSKKKFHGFLIFYQKHMSHHIFKNSDLSWLKNINNCILIRHPKYVINSYDKKYKLKDILQLGYVQQVQILNYLKNKNWKIPIIIDSSDILDDPKGMLKKLCSKLGINFKNQMLNWPKGKRETDGIWSSYWYENVFNSTGFIKPSKKKININKNLNDIYIECMKYYTILYDQRLKL